MFCKLTVLKLAIPPSTVHGLSLMEHHAFTKDNIVPKESSTEKVKMHATDKSVNSFVFLFNAAPLKCEKRALPFLLDKTKWENWHSFHIVVKRVSWFKSSLLLRIQNKHTNKY